MGNKGDIVAKTPKSGAVAVDQIGLELCSVLDRFLLTGGQSVDRQA